MSHQSSEALTVSQKGPFSLTNESLALNSNQPREIGDSLGASSSSQSQSNRTTSAFDQFPQDLSTSGFSRTQTRCQHNHLPLGMSLSFPHEIKRKRTKRKSKILKDVNGSAQNAVTNSQRQSQKRCTTFQPVEDPFSKSFLSSQRSKSYLSELSQFDISAKELIFFPPEHKRKRSRLVPNQTNLKQFPQKSTSFMRCSNTKPTSVQNIAVVISASTVAQDSIVSKNVENRFHKWKSIHHSVHWIEFWFCGYILQIVIILWSITFRISLKTWTVYTKVHRSTLISIHLISKYLVFC